MDCTFKMDSISVHFAFRKELASVELNGRYGLINKTGKVIIPFIYDYVSNFDEGLELVKLNDKYGFMDTIRKFVIPLIYDDAGWLLGGLAYVKLKDKYGLLIK